MVFMTLEFSFFEKKLLKVAFFSFLSTCYLILLMISLIMHYWCSKKVQSNIFLGAKDWIYGFQKLILATFNRFV